MIDKELLDILACPACKGDIRYDAPDEKLTCLKCGRRYPIRDDIPIMLEEAADVGDIGTWGAGGGLRPDPAERPQ